MTAEHQAEHDYGAAPGGVVEPPAVVLPERRLFSQRARRLRDLSRRMRSMADFLGFAARLAQAQHQVLQKRTSTFQPDSQAFDLALEHGMPPLSVQSLQTDLDWQEDLDAICDALELNVGQAQQQLIHQLRALDPAVRREIASEVLSAGSGTEDTRAFMPLVAAALQVAWLRQCSVLPRPPKRAEGTAQTVCPCCGALPVASLIQVGRERSRVRYMQCSICAAEWYMERARCTTCFETGQLDYVSLEGEDGKRPLPVRAETCGACESYVKIVHLDTEVDADALADDLASLGLDIMIANERDIGRSSYNPWLIAG
ncbi:formate dehydrogenase accessory protein FdhE [Kushneria indalinina]|uniref:FdhE protein n=1 Tax=Kushneria indalinina DSM 14324 TaxID=1122140 RepID=A0A3D9DX63_9GAMM|nr:formate dehydrogenase accessory protein FdhE [Kushneria indalinina]REC95370.1 FdhE protein [Kushneria indalinina DSM 14324]